MDSDIRFEVVDPAGEQAQWAMRQYFEELDRRFVSGFAVDEALDAAKADLAPPTGTFLVAMRHDEVVGCGGVLFVDADRGEIKRMWVNSTTRGKGLGRRLLVRLEDEVAAAGRSIVMLDTNAVLTQAIAMYRSAGYRDVERYNDNPYAELWFEKVLRP